jgi:hypothetical protein
VAEGARLESVFRGNSNVGSNPTLSARFIIPVSTLKTGLHTVAMPTLHKNAKDGAPGVSL